MCFIKHMHRCVLSNACKHRRVCVHHKDTAPKSKGSLKCALTHTVGTGSKLVRVFQPAENWLLGIEGPSRIIQIVTWLLWEGETALIWTSTGCILKCAYEVLCMPSTGLSRSKLLFDIILSNVEKRCKLPQEIETCCKLCTHVFWN